jgi:hypothetical protein
MSSSDEGRSKAQAQMENIIELVEALDNDPSALDQIYEGPLSIEVRSDWHSVGEDNNSPTEFRILLYTGGPAVKIIGELDEWMQPERPRLMYQDWFTPWSEYLDVDPDALLRYCQQFYFGE